MTRTVEYFKNCRKGNQIEKWSCTKGRAGGGLGQGKVKSSGWCPRALCHEGPGDNCEIQPNIPTQGEISHPASKQNEVSFDSGKCRWILQSKSALSVWCGTVTHLWHNIIWNDIEQHAFGTKLLAGFSFDSSKFIALIPRSFNPLWHKLRLAFVRKLHFSLSSFT